jgi:hypothetical protein
MIRTLHRTLAVILALSLSSPALAAPAADTHRRARQRFDEGLALVDAGELPRALQAFEEAYALEPNPAVLYNIGQALRALGRPQEALDALERYLAGAGQLEPARRQAVEQQLRELRERLPRRPAPEPATGELELRCLARGTRVFADGRWLGEGPFEGSLTVPEGLHEVRFENPSRPTEVRSVRVPAGQRVSHACTPPIPVAPPAPALLATTPPPRPARTGAYVTMASGVAVLGGALGVHLWNDHRHTVWKSERPGLEMLDTREPANRELQRQSNERLASIQRTDKVVWGLAAAGGLLLSIGATWWWARH